MKNFTFTIFLSFFLYSSFFGQICSQEKAQTIATNIIKERFGTISSGMIFKIQSVETFFEENIPVYYVFRLSPQGFVIISAQENVYPILAYSAESDFILDNNPAAKFWIDNYKKQIKYAADSKISATNDAKEAWKFYSSSNFAAQKNIKSVAPLLFTRWNQGRYYNAHCPADPAGPDGHVVVGCVATALGQIMNYFRHPNQGVSSYGYEHPVYGWQEVDLSQQTYDYDYMPVSPNDYNDNLARLLYNIGVSVDMNYGPNGSGMWNHKGAYTLKTYFDYNPATTYFFRDSMPPEFNWTQNLVDHLNQKIPLYYAGWSDYEFISGHAFILDGYNTETHYHVNWGWGGSFDGYFYIDNLTPGGSNFTLLHEVISFAVPSSEPTYCNENKIINSYEGVIDDGSGPLHPYSNNIECNWLIIPNDSANGIKLNFLKFDLDENDYIVIFDGDNENTPVLATFYGGQNTYEVISTADKVLVKFVTDSENTNDGWLLKYEGIRPVYCALMTYLYEPEGVITDGSGYFEYLNSTTCNWRIEPPNTENILITFEELDLEPVYDYVKVINSTGQTALQVSGTTIPEPILIVGHKASIMFKTNASVRAGGFKLRYETNVTNISKNTDTNIFLFPNPANDFINIISNEELKEITILSLDGKLLNYINVNNSDYCINIKDLSCGMYLLNIKTSNQIINFRLIKN